jgi:hypothetical protein
MRTLGNAIDTSVWNVGFGQAGKNKIVNGDFSNWQRSTNATVTGTNYFAPDRFLAVYVAGGATVTWSRQTFTPAAAPVAGYEGQYFSRIAATSGSGTTVMGLQQRIENVQTFAGQTATLSFWAKADSARTITGLLEQNFGSGGSSLVLSSASTTPITTSWARYSFTFSVASISGKTIGTSSYLSAYLYLNTGQASGSPQLDIWGVQFEYGSKATPFQTATGTIQGELAACQRYFQTIQGNATAATAGVSFAYASSTTNGVAYFYPRSSFRVVPSVAQSSLFLSDIIANNYTVTAVSVSTTASTIDMIRLDATVASGLTAKNWYSLQGNATTSFVQLSAEL